MDDELIIRELYKATFEAEQKSSVEQEFNALSAVTDLPIAHSTEETVKKYPYQLVTASSGEQAVEIVLAAAQRNEPFAVIFLDMRMPPGMDGLETARQILGIDPAVKIFFYTAHSDHSIAKINQVIGDEFMLLNKPIKGDQLIQSAKNGCAAWNNEAYAALSNQALTNISREMEEEIEARKRSELELIAARDEARAASEAKDEFLASMSHELRTPLTSIIGYSELARGDSRLPDDLRTMLNNSLLAGKTLLQLVNDILDMSKIRSGKFELNLQPFNLMQVVNDVNEVMRLKAQETDVHLKVQIQCELENLLVGDDVRLSQILFNLLSNAIKFTPSWKEVRLIVDCPVEDDRQSQIRFRVEDDGIGMSEAVVQKLFSPFKQADASISRRYGGTGLGLYISRQLAELMQGDITVESWEGVGSVFKVSIPFRKTDRKVETSKDHGADTEANEIPALKGRVLLAEDTKQIQNLIRILVEQTGAEVDVANDGLEAYRHGRTGQYDLILMDMQMPGMDGIEATSKLVEDGVSTPIFALTANVMERHRQQFKEAGCVGFLSKPVKRAKLHKALETFLDKDVDELLFETSEEDEDLSDLIPEEMWDDYYDYLATAEGELSRAVKASEWEKVKGVAHAIKGMAASYGHRQLSAIGSRLQDEALSEHSELRGSIADQLLSAIEQAIESRNQG